MSDPSTPTLTRRSALAGLGAVSIAPLLPSTVSFAQSAGGNSGDKRRPLIVILLRGGFDGLSLLPVPGDPAYANARGDLAYPAPGSRQRYQPAPIDLDGRFALNPAATSLLRFWRADQLAIAPAVAGAYRPTDGVMDHALAQRALATGTADSTSSAWNSGWLNRALVQLGGGQPPAFALGGGRVPAILAGSAGVEAAPPAVMGSPVAGLMQKAELLYRGDPLFGPALARAIKRHDLPMDRLGAKHLAAANGGSAGVTASNPTGSAPKSIRGAMDLPAAAALVAARMVRADGPICAVIEVSGFDAHFGEADNRAERRIAALAGGLETLADDLGALYERSVILGLSEFGRAVEPNITGGLDHGLAGPVLCMGGPVIGGIKGAWPGLARDKRSPGGGLAPSVDARAIFKRIVQDHWKITPAQINATVFPGANMPAPFKGLIRA